MSKQYSNWGLFPTVEGEIIQANNRAEVANALLQPAALIARGNGRCYGDAALAPRMLSMLKINQLLGFDSDNGMVSCEAGMLLSDLIPIIVSKGWFFHVTPGIKSITVGGAIASDVHGKNHVTKGCFSNWLVSFELMLENGQVLTCSKTENATLFWQTCGGMGWTGIILSATFQLMRISTTQMDTHTVQSPNFERLYMAMNENKEYEYAATWIDTTASGRQFGRGAAHFGHHRTAPESQAAPLTYPSGTALSMPFFAPSGLLNRLTINVFNKLYFQKNATKQQVVDMDAFFYPLDKILHWNRLYGRRGFVQYQFCLPHHNSFDGLRKVLQFVQKSGETPFLSVLKKHGERPLEAVNSFPIKGYSLALDFPRTKGIFRLVQQLDELVFPLGGKVYLTKDACSGPQMGRVDMSQFPSEKFVSLLKGRLLR